METVLGIYIRFAGWQGGTLAQAMDDFRKRETKDKDRFCTRIMHALDSKNLADIENAGPFFKARL